MKFQIGDKVKLTQTHRFYGQTASVVGNRKMWSNDSHPYEIITDAPPQRYTLARESDLETLEQ